MKGLLKYIAYAIAYTSVLFMVIILTLIFFNGGVILYDPNKIIVGFEIFIALFSLIVLTYQFFKKVNAHNFIKRR